MTNRRIVHEYSRHTEAFKLYRCIYCGDYADDEHHLLPISWTNDLEIIPSEWKPMMIIVPACGDCNHRLGSKVFQSFEESRDYVRDRIRIKYKKVLTVEPWTKEELDELGPTLRKRIEVYIAKRTWVEMRLSYYAEDWGVDTSFTVAVADGT